MKRLLHGTMLVFLLFGIAGCQLKPAVSGATKSPDLPAPAIESLTTPESKTVLARAEDNLEEAQTGPAAAKQGKIAQAGEALTATTLALMADPSAYPEGRVSSRLVSRRTDKKKGGYVARLAIRNPTHQYTYEIHVKSERAPTFFGGIKDGSYVQIKTDLVKSGDTADAGDMLQLVPVPASRK